MKQIRMLVTGVGRRVELMQAFRQAALTLGVDLKIFGADMAGTAPALAYCDYVRKVCGMKESSYIDELLAICKDDQIDLVLPTIDTDLLILSRNVARFEEIGVKVLVSKPDKVLICRDKNNTSDYFESCGLKAPRTYNDVLSYPGPYPCFIKPKDGSSSIDAFKVGNAEELAHYASKIADYVIQPFVAGTEFTVDIFCDFEGNPIYITPRERVAVRAGEVLKTRIDLDEIIISECRQLIDGFKPCGPMTVQLIRDEATGIDHYIEINPRFGGGAPLSMKAGARSAEALLRLVLGEEVGFEPGRCDQAIYSRFDQSVCISEGKDDRPLKGVIFDLDDTLYPEKEYVASGYRAVADLLGDYAIADEMWSAFEAGKPALDVVLEAHGLSNRKSDCLAAYRKHAPKVNLYDGALDLIRNLRSHGVKVGIITDGRPEGQRAKLDALELWDEVDDIIITDELGGTQFRKPNDIVFRIMQCRWRVPFEEIAYVGDNPNKDFQAPRQLGMKGVFFKSEDGLYSSTFDQSGFASMQEISDYLLAHI